MSAAARDHSPADAPIEEGPDIEGHACRRLAQAQERTAEGKPLQIVQGLRGASFATLRLTALLTPDPF